MKNIRYLLYAALILISIVLWNTWQKERPQQTVSENNQITTSEQQETNNQASQQTNKIVSNIPQDRIIHVKTDVLNIEIDTLGGKLIQADLIKYPLELNSTEPVTLLNYQPKTYYISEDGLIQNNIENNNPKQIQYSASQKSYNLNQGQKELAVTLNGKTADGLNVSKSFIFYPEKYNIDVKYNVKNNSGKNWIGNYYLQMLKKDYTPQKKGFLSIQNYLSVAYSTLQKPYEKIRLSKLSEDSIPSNIQGNWISIIERYFLGAWIPGQNNIYRYFDKNNGDGLYTVGMVSPKIIVQPNENINLNSTFYVGPKIADQLSSLSPHLGLTVDYSSIAFFSLLSSFIFWILKNINDVVGNWGWSIVIVTILIKLVFYKLSSTSYRSMAGMKKLQPKMALLKERYGNDKQAMSKATMELYKKEKINPLGGCLPILIQIPVFLALYWVLLESVELRQAPFIFWIHDLSIKDPYYVLPILMGITMYLQQKLSPTPPDPTQAKVMMFLPVMMTVFFLNFPAGLVLYWLVNNVLSIAQQWYITKKFEEGNQKSKKSHKG